MKRLIFKFIFGFVIVPLSLAGTLYYLNTQGFFNISQVDVVLTSVVDGQSLYLNPLVGELQNKMKTYQGQSLWDVDLRAVVEAAQSLEWVEGVAIKRSWPSTLQVQIQPYEVKFLYMGKGGGLTPVIREGQLLESVQMREAPDVALLEGDEFRKEPELRKKAVEVLEQIPREGSFSRSTISEVRYDSKEGFWMTMIRTGIQVKMGDEQVAIKAARVSQVLDYLENHQFDARVIDANLSKKVLVRLRKDP